MSEFAIAVMTIAAYQVSKSVGYSEYFSVGAAFCLNLAARAFASTQEMKPKNYHPGVFGKNNGFVIIEEKNAFDSSLRRDQK